ncbi:hypothetical protein ARMSODRAFT_967315 [Armillaria solidipes]|uniref:Uncharacterized protein n=1 Tax=Armillaria solidipes TaxID=1076256 RepID=A0A2H3AVS3_9AGAR|nr:hypothetical protein ARMSODRAFT_967315 [Armillaria solidipes]
MGGSPRIRGCISNGSTSHDLPYWKRRCSFKLFLQRYIKAEARYLPKKGKARRLNLNVMLSVDQSINGEGGKDAVYYAHVDPSVKLKFYPIPREVYFSPVSRSRT